MRPDTERYCAAICQGELLCFPDETPGSLDDLLSARNEPAFEAPWLRVQHQVEARLEAAPLDSRSNRVIGNAVGSAFKWACNLFESADLADLVADDVQLLAHALELGIEDGRLNALAAQYASGNFPCGPIEELSGSLGSILLGSLRGRF